eukprot:TRINITY_DN14204_c0_g1_i1.p1 TRINITY_DN14204_c0_g1~~TRINITY_DN14204_c0_g1_i1.p1  ORF type:complete len:303 (-),score=46.10 TRINITY_DN14204_c0_g1_i1:141-1049(-)
MASPTRKSGPPAWVPFAVGGLSGMGATLFVQPIDLIKTRMQLSGVGGATVQHKNFVSAFIAVAKSEGVAGLYKGLSAGLLRQATYTTTRLGVYNVLMEKADPVNKTGNILPFWQKALIGATAGGIGSIVGNPTEVALIRMTSDGRLPVEQRRNYTNAFNALFRITREEGVFTLWRGCTPTVVRAMVLNTAQLATYSQAKMALVKTPYFKEGLLTHFTASMISGLCATFVSLPVDLVKTRLQSMKPGEYGGILDVVKSVMAKEGVLSFWKGFWPYYLRLGPHTVLTFIFMEQMNKRIKAAYSK